jgi:hypothetical protein
MAACAEVACRCPGDLDYRAARLSAIIRTIAIATTTQRSMCRNRQEVT